MYETELAKMCMHNCALLCVCTIVPRCMYTRHCVEVGNKPAMSRSSSISPNSCKALLIALRLYQPILIPICPRGSLLDILPSITSFRKKGHFFAREETFQNLMTFAVGESRGFEGGGTPSSKIFGLFGLICASEKRI